MAIAVVLDTNILLNAKNINEKYSTYSLHILDSVEDGRIQGIISVISMAELYTGYYSKKDKRGKEELSEHLASTEGFVVTDLDLEIADAAVRIRADTGLLLPDAIVIATGIIKGAQYVITHDKELKKANRYLEVISSKELIDKIKHVK